MAVVLRSIQWVLAVMTALRVAWVMDSVKDKSFTAIREVASYGTLPWGGQKTHTERLG